MIKPIVPYGYTRAQGYPIFVRNEGFLSVQDKIYISSEEFIHTDLESFENLEFEGFKANGFQAVPDEAQHKMYVSYTYGVPSGANGSDNGGQPAEGIKEYTLDDSSQQIPVGKLKNDYTPLLPAYRLNWNHFLVIKISETDYYEYIGDFPYFKNLSDDNKWNDIVSIEQNFLPFRWIREIEAIEKDELVIRKPTKPAIEYYIRPSPVVVERKRYSRYNNAINNITRTGVLKKPDRVFGYTDGKWLVVSSSVAFDGRKWVVETRYQHALDWDLDLYKEA
jgi:hypothetical protein